MSLAVPVARGATKTSPRGIVRVVAGDVDGDERTDLVVLTGGTGLGVVGRLAVFRGTASGTLERAPGATSRRASGSTSRLRPSTWRSPTSTATSRPDLVLVYAGRTETGRCRARRRPRAADLSARRRQRRGAGRRRRRPGRCRPRSVDRERARPSCTPAVEARSGPRPGRRLLINYLIYFVFGQPRVTAGRLAKGEGRRESRFGYADVASGGCVSPHEERLRAYVVPVNPGAVSQSGGVA